MTELFTIICSLITGFLFGYLTSYFKEKGKNKALIEDTKFLTEEKEKVSSFFELDNSKRKYKYEYKSNLYFKYFNLLDELSAKANEDAQVKFLPALNQFNSSFLLAGGDTSKELQATVDFSNTINDLTHKANESFIRFKNETNSLKLIAGDDVLEILKETEKTYEESFNSTFEMMREFTNNVVSKKLDILEKQKIETTFLANKLIELKKRLIEEIRKELNEI